MLSTLPPPRIDLYSDTKSKPSTGMRKAIANAEVGDEQRDEEAADDRQHDHEDEGGAGDAGARDGHGRDESDAEAQEHDPGPASLDDLVLVAKLGAHVHHLAPHRGFAAEDARAELVGNAVARLEHLVVLVTKVT